METKRIKIIVIGYPKNKRKKIQRWLPTGLESLPTMEEAKDKALHWAMYKQRELGWRDCKMYAFGEFSVQDFGDGLTSETLIPTKTIQFNTI